MHKQKVAKLGSRKLQFSKSDYYKMGPSIFGDRIDYNGLVLRGHQKLTQLPPLPPGPDNKLKLPIRPAEAACQFDFKREILTLWLRISKRTITFAF